MWPAALWTEASSTGLPMGLLDTMVQQLQLCEPTNSVSRHQSASGHWWPTLQWSQNSSACLQNAMPEY